jgi:hypothetical protein
LFNTEAAMMNCANMMGGAGDALMMGGMALEALLLLALEILGIAVLIKYLLRPTRPGQAGFRGS